MTTHERERGRVQLYACGGGGINIGSKVDALVRKPDEVFAEFNTAFIDTSKSNLHAGVPEEKIYLIKGLKTDDEKDGSGQIRATNYEDIDAQTRDILQKFKPSDLNIVLSTGGGGSGAVIANSITSELLAKGAQVIVIIVGDDSTKKWTSNTYKTIESYKHISHIRDRAINAFYIQNGPEMTRAKVDDRVQALVASLCLLYSRRNRELDKADLNNWLNYETVTSHRPGLTALTIVDQINPANLAKLGNLISIATLTTRDVESTLPMRPEVQFVGFADDAAATGVFKAPYHFITSDGVFDEVSAHLAKVEAEMDEQIAARRTRSTVGDSRNVATKSGVVL